MLKKLTLFLLFSLGILITKSQETTSFITGIITDQKGVNLPGVSVSFKHEPTGYFVNTQTNNKGIFVLPNLKPGGPYTVKLTFLGFKDEIFQDIYLQLGSNPDFKVALESRANVLKEVTVTASGKKVIAGATTINSRQLQTLPTLGRSLSDFTRATPQSNNNSFAGSSFRYNNLTIDGAINNDAIGFSNSFGGVSGGGQSGAAGAGTRTNPYSIDVIQEVQVQLSPYDVKLGNFTGGSVNAVTKSGTNAFHGSVYAYGRNKSLMGKSIDGLKNSIGSDFYDYQYGTTIGGPIVQNKSFFIVNFEQTRRQEPTFYNAGELGSAISLSDAQSISSRLASKGYDVGSYGAYKIFTNSDKLFARFDFNLNSKNSLMVRALYTNGWGNNLERSSTNFQFSSTDFTQYTKNVNLTAELKTKFNNYLSNQFNISYINVHEYRDFPGTLAPFIDIDNGRIWAGTWREASIYNMKQQTVEISDNVTLLKGKNKFTFGTHNEFYNLTYGFINSWNGRWEYSRGVNSFLADNPSRVRGAFTIDPKIPNDRETIYSNPPNPFKVALLSVYGQDEISVSAKFKLTAGFRLDYSYTGNQPGVDAALNSTVANSQYTPPTYTTKTPFDQLQNKWLGNVNISPRIGFSYDVNKDGKIVIRGGTGIFVGRMPFAWMGYGYTLNGSTYGNIDWNGIGATTTVPLAINPYGLKDTVTKYGGASRSSTREVDVVDNNYKLPTIWRSNIAVDYKFGNGYKLGFDFMFTKTIYDVKFQQINLFDSAQYFTSGPTQSPVYVARVSGTNGKYNSVYSNVYYLSNTNEGYRYNATIQLSKISSNVKIGSNSSLNLAWSLAYTYGMSKDISNGIRNSWESNFNLNPVKVANNPELSYSNFDMRHRIVGTFGSTFKWNEKNATSLSFFYSGQSGNPYTLIYQSTPGTGGSNAPLVYIPANISDIRLADYTLNGVIYTAAQQWTDLDNFIRGDKYLQTRRGQYAERNGMRTPWNHQLDMKLMHEFKLSKSNSFKTLQVSLDIFNVFNLLNNDWGHVNFVTNVNNYTINFLKFATDANGKAVGTPASGYTPTFNFVKPSGVNGQYYTVDPINSRWQGQLGIKYNF
jgi:Carboxypeptidase regulatory-like domain